MTIDKRPATLTDVAVASGVSIATVSYVLSGRSDGRSAGSRTTRQKVVDTANSLGYAPNRAARSVRTGKTGAIVLALPVAEDPWTIALTRSVSERGAIEGLSTLLLPNQDWHSYLRQRTADAAFISSVDSEPDAGRKVRDLASAGIGVVAFSEELEPDGFDVIASSALPAIGMAVDLLEPRVQKLGFFGAVKPTQKTVGPDRYREFERVVADRKFSPDRVSSAFGGYGRQSSFAAAVDYLSGGGRPDAVIASSGYLATSLALAATMLGLSMPEDLSLVSIGDIPEDEQVIPRISYYGTENVFSSFAEIVVARALGNASRTGTRSEFKWRLFEGQTLPT